LGLIQGFERVIRLIPENSGLPGMLGYYLEEIWTRWDFPRERKMMGHLEGLLAKGRGDVEKK
jgi:hypothetical protein